MREYSIVPFDIAKELYEKGYKNYNEAENDAIREALKLKRVEWITFIKK